ncbi:MAG TPA: glycosyltransferase family 39 protein [Verrucomicrobiae bacterium]|nr:glycosyltransferase family 39 protein [Verrucomicrobiae bacterium]
MNTTTRFVVMVFTYALALRLLVVFGALPKFHSDVDLDSYRSLARNLAAGSGFIAPTPDGRELPSVARTPTYPLFLAALIRFGGDRLDLFLAAQCLLGALTAALTAALATRWFRPHVSLLAGLLVAVDPNSVLRCADLRTETLFTLLLLSGVCLVASPSAKKPNWLAAGILWSVAALARPIAIWIWLVPIIVIGVARVSWRDKAVAVALFLIGFCPLLGIWIARNHSLTGRCFVSTISTYNLLMYRAAGIEAELHHRQLDDVQRDFLARYGDIQFVDDQSHFQQSLADYQHAALDTIRSSPFILAKQTAIGWGKLLLGPGTRALEYSLAESKPVSKFWPPLYSLVLLTIAAFAVVGARRLGRDSILLVLLVLYFVVLAGGPESNSRFRVPVTPMLAVLAVVGTCGVEKKP